MNDIMNEIDELLEEHPCLCTVLMGASLILATLLWKSISI